MAPIIISCIIYVMLISSRNRKFQNKVENSEIETPKSVQNEIKNRSTFNPKDQIENVNNMGNSPVEDNARANAENIEESVQAIAASIVTETVMENIKEVDDQMKQKSEEKIQAQISAAERSLKTNFVVAGLFFSLFGLLIVMPKTAKAYFTIIYFSLLKTALPVLTAIANFGTVQSVVTQYWKYFKGKIKYKIGK
jgi:hypothetical protein